MSKSARRPNPPAHISVRSGCKVHWRTYATEADAKLASTYARDLAVEYAAQGYDYGYCQPGSIERVQDGWEVCWP